jgi:DNA topoisomerase-1
MKPIVQTDPNEPGYSRIRRGRGFAILSPRGRAVTDERILRRVNALVIPPAWTNVWIAAAPEAHIQAIGSDADGRRQYIYHPLYRAAREQEKFQRLLAFAAMLPRIRERVAKDMAAKGLPREKVLATVVHLLDRTLIRIGNRAYAEANKSFGLSTLRSPHVEVGVSTVRFEFRGKSGREWRVKIADRRIAKVIRSCQELPGQPLFQYLDEDKGRRSISSGDVNGYLQNLCGSEISAKDFRTWAGTVLCAVALSLAPPAESEAKKRRQVTSAVRAVAYRLGNTPAVCRSSYIHPAILIAHADGALFRYAQQLNHPDSIGAGHSPAERVVMKILKQAPATGSLVVGGASRRFQGRTAEPSRAGLAEIASK